MYIKQLVDRRDVQIAENGYEKLSHLDSVFVNNTNSEIGCIFVSRCEANLLTIVANFRYFYPQLPKIKNCG